MTTIYTIYKVARWALAAGLLAGALSPIDAEAAARKAKAPAKAKKVKPARPAASGATPAAPSPPATPAPPPAAPDLPAPPVAPALTPPLAPEPAPPPAAIPASAPLAPGLQQEAGMSLGDLRDFIFAKLDYDQHYFSTLVEDKKRGRTPASLSKEKFAEELQRAYQNMPVLRTYQEERASYQAGRAFTLPKDMALHRVYGNLLSILNMLEALERKDHEKVLAYGAGVVISEKESLGQVRGQNVDYYLKLYREYFYLMGAANYRVGNDKAAVDWFARLEADTDLQALKSKIEKGEAPKPDSREGLLASLRIRPVAVMPLSAATPVKEYAWLSTGIMEIMVSDLVQETDLFVIERAQLDKVLGETILAQQGVTRERYAEVGKLLSAGTLLVGTYRPQGEQIDLSLELVAAESGRILGTAKGRAASSALVDGVRETLIQLLGGVGWLDDTAQAAVRAAHAPKMDTLKKLMEARLLLATKADAAKELYSEAMKEDPTYAKMFNDLQAKFSDITATVGIMPFLNVTADPQDKWMTDGVVEALSADLPKLNLSVVERAKLAVLVEEVAKDHLVAIDDARKLGQELGADFLVLGSVMHTKPNIRIDLRFVEVRTGMVVFSTSAEDGTDNFMTALVTLTTAIATRFNQELSEEQLSQLAAKKMSAEEFRDYVTQQLAKQSLDKARAREARPALADPIAQQRFWTKAAISGGVVAALASVTLFALSGQSYSRAQQAVDLRDRSTASAYVDHYQSEADRLASQGNILVGTGLGLGVLAVVAAAYAFLAMPDASTSLEVAPVAAPGGAVGLSLSGAW